ncbi:isocitrate lyase/PEP mutase family protein [Rhodococcus sp. 06-418-5]|uniref:isocitrate lyase/PEP mutase family protein n=1 Tax=Rhodococcus sp. 06-418-5 TaxID=2022507 RepID=UPI00211B60B4|nr:oxaloacetate decarboxylase [Rhodococcus sp. 06-418-5]
MKDLPAFHDTHPARRLRAALADVSSTGPIIAPGAYDALSARLIEQAGFGAVYLTGFGATASLLGMPDIGLLTGTEMADQARRLVTAVGLPVIADADTGYGNAINVARTVALYEQAGVAGIQLEDQVAPKKCGHMSGKAIVPVEEMVGKIHAAVDARKQADTVLIARTDAIAVDGIDAAIERAHLYRAAGADVLFVEAPTSETDIEKLAGSLASDMPLVFNWAEGGRTPGIGLDRIRELGFALVLYPIATLLAATSALQAVLADIREHGTPSASLPSMPSFDDFTDTVGLPEILRLEKRYTPELSSTAV